MRVLAKVTLPVEAANEAIKEGRIGTIMQEAAERWKPEGMYFSTFDGKRTAFIVFDLPAPSDMVVFAEPFFLGLNADVQVAPAMDAADLAKGLSQIG